MCQKYQGYENYETWCVSLWLNNSEADYEHFRELAKELKDVKKLAISIENEIGNYGDELIESACLFKDLLNNSLEVVNWEEVAKDFLDE